MKCKPKVWYRNIQQKSNGSDLCIIVYERELITDTQLHTKSVTFFMSKKGFSFIFSKARTDLPHPYGTPPPPKKKKKTVDIFQFRMEK